MEYNREAKTLEFIPQNKLKKDPDYQRDYNYSRVKDIASKWNDKLCNPLHVSLRKDGFYYSVDGQHTFGAFKIVHYGEAVPCFVYRGLNKKAEADLFIKLNTNFKKPAYGDILRSSIVSGDVHAVKYEKMLKETKTPYTFNKAESNGKLYCHDFLMKKMKTYGIDFISKVLRFISETELSKDPSTVYRESFLSGLILFMNTYENEIDFVHFRKNITSFGSKGIKVKADYYLHLSGRTKYSGRKSGCFISRGLVDVYNKGYGQKNPKHLDAQKIMAVAFDEE